MRRVKPQRWVFGIVALEFAPARPIVHVVKRRDAPTFLRLIQHHCLPGTTVRTDCWAAYDGIARLGCQHQTVNHRHNFVDPFTGKC